MSHLMHPIFDRFQSLLPQPDQRWKMKTQCTRFSVDTAPSWGVALRQYEARRQNLTWSPANYRPEYNSRVTRHLMSRREREYDPILARYRDEEREQALAGTEHVKLQKQREVARRKQLTLGSKHNIVNNEEYADAPPHAKRCIPVKPPDSLVPFNIINSIRRERAAQLKLGVVPDVLPITPRKTLVDGNKVPFSHYRRDFNLLNNQYSHDNESRSAAEAERVQQEMKRRYDATHHYNVIQARYYDQAEEDEYLRKRAETAKVKAKSKLAREPQSFRFSEGRAFDLLTGTIKDGKARDVVLSREARSRRGRYGAATETRLRREGQEADQCRIERSANRVSEKSFEASPRRGFDAISLQPYAGEGAKLLPQPHVRRQTAPWHRVASAAASTSHQVRQCSREELRTSPTSFESEAGAAPGTSHTCSQEMPRLPVPALPIRSMSLSSN